MSVSIRNIVCVLINFVGDKLDGKGKFVFVLCLYFFFLIHELLYFMMGTTIGYYHMWAFG